jgi:hypothetical protein
LTQSFSLARELLPLCLELTGGLGALLGILKSPGDLLLQPSDFLASLLLHLLGLYRLAPPGLALA